MKTGFRNSCTNPPGNRAGPAGFHEAVVLISGGFFRNRCGFSNTLVAEAGTGEGSRVREAE